MQGCSVSTDEPGRAVGPDLGVLHDRGWRSRSHYGICGLLKTWVRPGGMAFPAWPDLLIFRVREGGVSVSKRNQDPGGLLQYPPGAGEIVLAASNNNHSFVTGLFESAADPGARDINDKRPWDYAQGSEALKTQAPKSNLRIFG